MGAETLIFKWQILIKATFLTEAFSIFRIVMVLFLSSFISLGIFPQPVWHLPLHLQSLHPVSGGELQGTAHDS